MNEHEALTRGKLAERIGVPPHWVTRNVPEHLFIGNRIHWHEYCQWRMDEQKRLATSGHARPEPSAPTTAQDRRWQAIARRFDAPSKNNGRPSASHVPVGHQQGDNESHK